MAYVEVERKALRQALRTLRHAAKSSPYEEFVLSYEDNSLNIGCIGASTAIDASGRWRGRAILPSQSLLKLARLLPDDDPIRLEVREGRIRIGTFAMSCKWMESSPRQIKLPLNPPFLMLLSVGRAYSPSEIESQDVRTLVDEAEKRATEVIHSAHRELAPFGIPKEAVTKLVESFIPEWKWASSDSNFVEDQQGPNLRVAGEQIELADDLR